MQKIIYKKMYVYTLHRSDELDHEKGRPAILLKYKSIKSLVWIGTRTRDLKTKETPLILNINNVKGYFYSSGIERIENKYLVSEWVNFKTYQAYKLNNIEQQQLISKFVTFTFEKDPYLENEKLETENKELKKQICIQSLKLKNRNHG